MLEPRRWYASPWIGGLIGVFAGGLAIMLIEMGGHLLFGSADPSNPSTITVPMFLSVLVAWIAGCWIAATVATVWSGARSIVPGVVCGVVLLAGAVMNFVTIPHPAWLMIAAFVLMPGTALLAAKGRLAPRS